ncbi:MAG: O-antigen ligase family protein [Clostridia bacterium]|nr:O-antigen ligase family protein [Clostridia bacterium]
MRKYIDSVMRWLLYTYICILPWIVFKKNVYYNSDEKILFPSKALGITDYFLYGKAAFTIIAAVLFIILLIMEKIICRDKIIIIANFIDKLIVSGVTIYSICTVMSLVLAKYKKIALWGGINSFEGTLVLLSYVVIFIAARHIFSNIETEKRMTHDIRYIVLIEAVILAVMTCVECMYKPLYFIFTGTDLGDFNNMLLLTFYNSTYCAAFILILLPFCLYYLSESNRICDTIIWTVFTVTTWISMVLTKSTTGFYLSLVEIITFIFIAICIKKRNFITKNNIQKIIIISGCSIMVPAVFKLMGINIWNPLQATSVNETIAIHKNNYYKLEGIDISDNVLNLKGVETSLKCIINEQGNIYFTDKNDKQLSVSVANNVIHFSEPYQNVEAGIENDALWIDLGYKGKIRFLIHDNRFYPMAVDGSVINDISGNDGNSNYDYIFTGRGYIWRNSLPILKNTVVFGHGAGTFEMYFKQFDYVGLLNSQGNIDLIIDKPHNWYIQMACNEGVFAMASVIIIIICSIVNSIRCQLNVRRIITLLVPATLAMIVFSVMECFTDSYVTVNPLMWIILGATSVTYKNKSDGGLYES